VRYPAAMVFKLANPKGCSNSGIQKILGGFPERESSGALAL